MLTKNFGQRNIVFEVKTRLPRFTRSSARGQIYDGLDEQLVAMASGNDKGDKKPVAKPAKPAYEGLDSTLSILEYFYYGFVCPHGFLVDILLTFWKRVHTKFKIMTGGNRDHSKLYKNFEQKYTKG